MYDFKSVIDNTIYKALDELGQELTEKYYGKEVFVHFGIDQNRNPVNKRKVKVKEFNIIENDGRFEIIQKFSKLVYVVVLMDQDDNEIWIKSLDFSQY